MTLCIAAHCGVEYGPGGIRLGNPCVVACFDAEIQTDIARSESGYKFWLLSDHWVALMSGVNHVALELLELYEGQLLSAEPSGGKAEIIEHLRKPPRAYRRRLAQQLVQARFAISYEEFLQNGAAWFGDEVHRQTLYEISAQFSQLQQDAELILIGMVQDDFALYKFSRGELIECDDFAAIGSGSMIAEPVLYQRELDCYTKISTAAYVAYEAKRLGENAPGVGKRTNMLRVRAESGTGKLTTEYFTNEQISILEGKFEQYGPKSIADMPPFNLFESGG